MKTKRSLMLGMCLAMAGVAGVTGMAASEKVNVSLVVGRDAEDEIITAYTGVAVKEEEEVWVFSNQAVVDEAVKSYYVVEMPSSKTYDIELVGENPEESMALFAPKEGSEDLISSPCVLSLTAAYIGQQAEIVYYDKSLNQYSTGIEITGYVDRGEDEYSYLEYRFTEDLPDSDSFSVPAAVIAENGSAIGVISPEGRFGRDLILASWLEEVGTDTEVNGEKNADAQETETEVQSEPELKQQAHGAEEEETDAAFSEEETAQEEILTWEENGITYTGHRKDGKIDGIGMSMNAEGDFYSGEWKNGVKDGFGRSEWADGYVYEGEYEDGLYKGYAVQTYDEKIIVCQFKGDDRAWKLLIPADQSSEKLCVWQGSVVEGSAQYDGLYFSLDADGGYSCTWYEKGQKSGTPLVSRKLETGEIYTGKFDEDAETVEGTTVIEYPSEEGSAWYIGSMENGKWNGSGVYLFRDGSVYVGEFADNNLEGEGLYYAMEKDGTWVNGTFRSGRCEGSCVRYSDGGYYRVQYQNGVETASEKMDILWSKVPGERSGT